MVKTFSFILCFFLFQGVVAQHVEKQTDSLLNIIKTTEDDSTIIEIYTSLANLNFYSRPIKAIQYCREQIVVCEKNEDNATIFSAYTQMFNAQLFLGAPADTLLHTIQLLKEHVDTHLEEDRLVFVYWVYALYYNNINQTDKEIEAYIKALAIERKYDSRGDIEGALLGNIANILISQGKYEEAKEYLNKGLEIIKDTIGLAELYFNLGVIYVQEQDYEKALKSIRQSYDYYQIGQDSKGMANVLIEEGRYYDKINEFQKSNQSYDQANEIIKTNNIGSLLPTLYARQAEHYQKRKDYKAAIKFGEQSLTEINKQENYKNLSTTYNILQESYAQLGYYKKAYELRSKEIVHRDSVNSSELLSKVETLRTELEVEQKEMENQLLKAEAASNQKTIQSRNITTIALFLGFLLILSWAMVVFRNNRQKQKYNEQLEVTVSERTTELKKVNKDLVQANYELKTFNHIASHDVKEPIRNIGNHIGLIYRKLPLELKSEYKDYFDTIRASSSQLYTVVEDFSRYTQLSKDEEVIIQPVDLNKIVSNLEIALIDIENPKNAKIINRGLSNINTNASMIYIILKNIVENGLKFNESLNPTVSLSTKSCEEYVEVFIADNGIGIETAYQEQIFDMFKRLNQRKDFEGSGMGLAIVKLLMDKLAGSVKIESHINKGSTFILRLPVSYASISTESESIPIDQIVAQ